MKKLFLLLAISLVVPVVRAGISEPETVLYGRVIIRFSGHEIPVTEGRLSWSLVNLLPTGMSGQFVADLGSLADGQFQYRLNLPHELLAYDLTVGTNVLPLTAGELRFDHVEILLDGCPVNVLEPAPGYVVVQQVQRAATHRVDLQVQIPSLDSDGDGVPDWLEDRAGLDKWDPEDGAAYLASLGGGQDPGAMTLAIWREVHFPGNTEALEAFAQQDPEGDGVPNLLEYAFDLNPLEPANDQDKQRQPAGVIIDGHFNIAFARRTDATDLEYVIEASDNLVDWAPAAGQLEQVTNAEAGSVSGLEQHRETAPASANTARFLRVRVIWNP